MKKVIMNLMGIILYFFYCLLNLVFFRKKKRLTFISFPDVSDNSWHLYKYCLGNLKGFELVWLIDNCSLENTKKILDENYKNNNIVIVKKRWSLSGFIYFCNSKIIFFTHGTYFFIRPCFFSPIFFNLWHGMPIKAIGNLEKKQKKYFCYSDYVICTSEYYKNIMSNVFKININKVWVTGLPRNDVLHAGLDSNKILNIKEKLDIYPSEKYIIWLPTYRVSNIGEIRSDSANASFLSDFYENFIYDLNKLCVDKSLKLIVKMHPMDSFDFSKEKSCLTNIIFLKNEEWNSLKIDLYECISGSSGLLSDFSSVIIDCINTRIPIGILYSKESKYFRKLLFDTSDLFKCTLKIEKPEDVINLINFSNSYSSKYNTTSNSCENICAKLGLIDSDL